METCVTLHDPWEIWLSSGFHTLLPVTCPFTPESVKEPWGCRNRNRMTDGDYRAEAIECWRVRMQQDLQICQMKAGQALKRWRTGGCEGVLLKWWMRGSGCSQWEREQNGEFGHMRGSDWNYVGSFLHSWHVNEEFWWSLVQSSKAEMEVLRPREYWSRCMQRTVRQDSSVFRDMVLAKVPETTMETSTETSMMFLLSVFSIYSLSNSFKMNQKCVS